MVRGPGEVVGEVDEELRCGPGVAVDDLVVVAHAEAVEAGGHQQPDEEQVGRGQVLEFVDQHPAAPGLGGRPGRRVGEQDLDGPVDLLVEVDLAPFGQRGAVAGEPVRHPGRVGIGLLGGLRGDQTQPDQGQGGHEGCGGVGVGLALDLEQFADQFADPHLVQYPDRAVGPEPVADPQGEAVEGPHVGTVRAEHVGDPVAQLVGGPGVVGQRRHHLRCGAPTDQEAEAFGQDPGLARAGRGDDPDRSRRVVDGGQLVRGQVRVGRTPGVGRQPTGLGGPPVDGVRPVVGRRGVGRPAVDPPPPSVGPGHVGGPTLGHPPLGQAACGPAPVPPHRVPLAGVVAVGPHQEVQPFAPERESRIQRVHGAAVVLRLPEHVGIERQFDHHGAALRPGGVEHPHHRPGIDQRGVVHDHARCVGPRAGCGVTRAHHHTPAEGNRPGTRHRPNLPIGCADARRAPSSVATMPLICPITTIGPDARDFRP